MIVGHSQKLGCFLDSIGRLLGPPWGTLTNSEPILGHLGAILKDVRSVRMEGKVRDAAKQSNTKRVRLQRRVRHIAKAYNTKSVRVERTKGHIRKENNTKSVRVETTIRPVTQ